MAQLVIELKQHTPILHFQHGQQGATLRATEVKPKLDKFIHQVFERKKLSLNPDWLIGPDKRALDYKMRIRLKGEGRQEFWVRSASKDMPGTPSKLTINNSPYFAQTEKEKKFHGKFVLKLWNSIEKKGLFWGNNVEIVIFSLSADLVHLIAEHIEAFFICTNFGTRSDKGFGSFTIVKKDEKTVTNDPKSVLKDNFDFVYQRSFPNGCDFSRLFAEIKKDYNLIRQGLRTFRPSRDDDRQWDKALLKQIARNPYDEFDENEYEFKRGMLGLSYEYSVENKNRKKIKIKVADKYGKVERFQSPLLFKYIEGNLYLVGSESLVQNMLNQSFTFQSPSLKTPITLKTPEVFSLKYFLKYVIGKSGQGRSGSKKNDTLYYKCIK